MGSSIYKSGIVSYTSTSWCYNCNCKTQTYFENDGSFTRCYCNVCGKCKWRNQ